MTFSVVARCERTGQLGVGAVTAMMGVGKLVTYAAPKVGAIATQATINPYLGIDGLRMMAEGVGAPDTMERLIQADPGRDTRQAGYLDAHGDTAAWTGKENPPWSGHMGADNVMAQGNRLVGPETLESTLEAFAEHGDLELAERLLVALEAGEATGADTKGALSGTIYVVDTEEYPLWDLRVDHADDPAATLRHLFAESRERLIPQVKELPTRADPMGDAARKVLGHG
ncbi:DUF1028 domain-containing protein [Phytoactinopolyspora alkaliphila]|uniref:DUF1028 domain-containing protein n=1 Tax=Phytoactinopolyspora alkaliphila TaxID=1783498 RepID=A0A6N9YPM6_9ACTN|nr:DUF1028 domain-containing protein [Phytoactinopolyspora alkaliphila]NED96924.1 DUF1028 domain-containing protein [Phytoactinopolyspora alkaliphila]